MNTDIPAAVANLRLKSAFKGYAVDVMDCIVSSDLDPLYIIDDDKAHHSRLASADEILSGGFTGYNPTRKCLHLLSIDNMLMKNTPGGVADCAMFCLDNFAFIEFKTNAEGRTNKSSEETYNKAISQLKNTLRIFSDKLKSVGIDFAIHITIVSHIVVSTRFPRSSASELNYMVEFFDNTGTDLSFDNSRIF